MSTITKVRQAIQAIGNFFQQIIQYISIAATRAFSPSDDNYPATGLQPYEGDPAIKSKDY
ncbi:hypothetical protein NIES22_29100 [Calothrix brevissima NIES-22]|nr:hypothetical protein NIES22_29100 [Calothrix brevissima NIES-22]